MRFGLLMRWIALDWTLSRRWREDLGAIPPDYCSIDVAAKVGFTVHTTEKRQ